MDMLVWKSIPAPELVAFEAKRCFYLGVAIGATVARGSRGQIRDKNRTAGEGRVRATSAANGMVSDSVWDGYYFSGCGGTCIATGVRDREQLSKMCCGAHSIEGERT
jgi:hypothetical protein